MHTISLHYFPGNCRYRFLPVVYLALLDFSISRCSTVQTIPRGLQIQLDIQWCSGAVITEHDSSDFLGSRAGGAKAITPLHPTNRYKVYT